MKALGAIVETIGGTIISVAVEQPGSKLVVQVTAVPNTFSSNKLEHLTVDRNRYKIAKKNIWNLKMLIIMNLHTYTTAFSTFCGKQKDYGRSSEGFKGPFQFDELMKFSPFLNISHKVITIGLFSITLGGVIRRC